MSDHLSIGEVLSLLQDEFPDVTISKIRFLESQGLINPERTPSGYRKFYEADIDRLRWILRQQREHFLPLKVIKDRLQDPEGGQGALLLSTAEGASEPGPPPPPPADRVASGSVSPEPTPRPEPVAAEPKAKVTANGDDSQPIWMADHAKASAETKASAAATAAAVPLDAPVEAEVSLTAKELALAVGITNEALAELERFGLIQGRSLGDAQFYDGDALLIATKAAAYLNHGVDVRHLRMFKVAAEREAGFLEQLAMPLLKQRNPQSRREAIDLVEELSGLGGDLRAALLRSNLRQHLDQA